MIWIDQFSSSPFAWFCGWALVHSLWQVAAIWLLIKSSTWTISTSAPKTKYWMNYFGLILCFLLPVLSALTLHPYQAPKPQGPFLSKAVQSSSAPQAFSNEVQIVGSQPFTEVGINPINSSNGANAQNAVQPENGAPVIEPPIRDRVAALPGSIAETKQTTAAKSASTWMALSPILVIVYLSGVFLLSLRTLAGLAFAHRFRYRQLTPVAESVQKRFESLCQQSGIKKSIGLMQSGIVSVPTVIGILRPMILLPLSTVSSLSAKELDAILLHELGHIRRSDILFNLFQVIIETMLFFHPLVWSISKQIRLEREKCCDDLAADSNEQKKALAFALLRLEELKQSSEANPVAFSMSSTGGNLKARIRRLLVADPGKTSPIRGLVFSSTLTLLLVTLMSFTAFIVPSEEAVASEQDDWTPVGAKIEYRGDIFQWSKLTTEDPDKARRMLDLFPQADKKKRGQKSGEWTPDTTFTIELRNSRNGETRDLIIQASFEAGRWSEGNGDWEFGPTFPFRYLISDLVREQKFKIGDPPKAQVFRNLEELKKLPKDARYLRFQSDDDNAFKDSWMEALADRFESLEILEIPRARSLTDQGALHLSKLTNLYALKIGFSAKLSSKSAKEISKLKRLQLLDLSYTRGLLTDEALADLLNLPKLTFFVALKHSGGGFGDKSVTPISDHKNVKNILITAQHPISKSVAFIPRLTVVNDYPHSKWFRSFLRPLHDLRKAESVIGMRNLDQATNLRTYTRNRKLLDSVEKGKWVVIAGGKLCVAFDDYQSALAFADKNHPQSKHRFIFRPGIDDKNEPKFYLSPWKTGSPNWNQLGRQFHQDQQLTISAFKWIRNRKSLDTPNGKGVVTLGSIDGKQSIKRSCVVSGMFNRYLTLTETDAEALGLYKSSAPGKVQYGNSGKCDRVFCMVKIPELEIDTLVLAFVIPDRLVQRSPTVSTTPVQEFTPAQDIQIIGERVLIQRAEMEVGSVKNLQAHSPIKTIVNESDGKLDIVATGPSSIKVSAVKPGKFHFTANLKNGIKIRWEVTAVKSGANDKQAKIHLQKVMNEMGKPKFLAHGIVQDTRGNPVVDAKVTAFYGLNGGRATGSALTDKFGRYVLTFTEGYKSFIPNDFTTAFVPLQRMQIRVEKSGMLETKNCRAGIRFVSGETPKDLPAKYLGDKTVPQLTMLAGKPVQINFTMRPSANLTTYLLDENEKRMATRTVVVHESTKIDQAMKPEFLFQKSMSSDNLGKCDFRDLPSKTDLVIQVFEDGKLLAQSKKFQLKEATNHYRQVQLQKRGNGWQIEVSQADTKKIEDQAIRNPPIEARGIAIPKEDKRKLKFGKPVNGLSAAVYVKPQRHAEVNTYRPGELIEIMFVIRNTSDKTVTFQSNSWRQEDQVILTGPTGAVFENFNRSFYSGLPRMIRHELKPGEECILNSGAVHVGETGAADKPDGKSLPVYFLKAGEGTNQIRFKLNFPDVRTSRGKDDSGDWKGKLETGDYAFDVADVKKK